MTVRVGARGPVVIPKAIRDRAGLQPGDEVDVELRDGEGIVIVSVKHEDTPSLAGRFVGSGLAGRLVVDRAQESR